MQLCPVHWQALKQSLIDKGLAAFAKAEPKEALERFARMLQSKTGPERATFAPLVSATYSICMATVNKLGPAVLRNDGAQHCPLCDLCAQVIWKATEEQLELAKKLGLVESV